MFWDKVSGAHTIVEREQLGQVGPDLRARSGLGRLRGGPAPAELGADQFDGGQQQVVLAGEVVLHLAERDAGRRGDLPHAHGLEPTGHD